MSAIGFIIGLFLSNLNYVGAALMAAAVLLVIMKKEGVIVTKKVSTERVFKYILFLMFMLGMVLLIFYFMAPLLE